MQVDPLDPLDPLDLNDLPDGTHTPPTPPSQTPPAFPLPMRVRAVAQLRPVSIPASVRYMAGKNLHRNLAEFDRHYMPDGVPEQEASVTGNDDKHRSNLKRKSEGISRSLSEVLTYLTYNPSSLNEAKKLLSIITNVSMIILYIIAIICIISHICIIHIISFSDYALLQLFPSSCVP